MSLAPTALNNAVAERTNRTPAARRFDTAMAWLLPAMIGIAPFAISFALIPPDISQSYFVQIAACLLASAHGIAFALGWRPLPRRIDFPGGLLLANVVLLVASAFNVPSPIFMIFAFKALLPVLGGVLFGVMLALHPARELVLRRTGIVAVTVAALLAVYGIAQYFGYEFLPYSSEVQKNTVIATIGHPNYLASVLGPSVFILIGLSLSRRTALATIIGGLLCALILFCIYVARTRGVWLGLVMGFAATAFIATRYRVAQSVNRAVLRGFYVAVVVMALALAGGVFVLLPTLKAQVNLVDRITSNKEIKSRFFYWNAAIDMALEKPVFGQGYARFDPLFSDYVLIQQKTDFGPYYADFIPAIANHTPGHVHNEYFELMCEQGFLGLLVFLALACYFLFYGYHAVLHQRDPGRGLQGAALLGGFVCVLVDAFFAFPFRLPISLLTFALIMAWIYNLLAPRSTDPSA